MATRNIVPRATGEGSIGTAAKHWGAGHFDTLPNWQEYLAESTGYGIVSGCTPSISGLTVTVGAGVVHLAGGTRKEIEVTNITLDNADSTNPRIDLVYITADGVVAKVTGTAAASPVVPTLPTGGISVCNVTIAAGATTGTVNRVQTIAPNLANYGVVNVKDFGAKGDGVTDDTEAIQAAVDYAGDTKTVVFPTAKYYIDSISLKSTTYDFKNSVIKVKENGGISSIGTVKKETTLSSAYTAGSKSVTVADAGTAEIGDIVVLKSTDVWNPTRPHLYFISGTFVIENVSGNTLTISPSLPLEMSATTTTATIYKPNTTTIKNIGNFEFEDSNFTNPVLLLKGNINSVLSNIKLTNPVNLFMGIWESFNCIAKNLDLTDLYNNNDNPYYVFQNSCSTNTKLLESNIISNWHCYSSTGMYMTIDSVIDKCVLRIKGGGQNAIGDHNCVYSLSVLNSSVDGISGSGDLRIENCDINPMYASSAYNAQLNFCGNYSHPEFCNLTVRNTRIHNLINNSNAIILRHENNNPTVAPYSGINKIVIDNLFADKASSLRIDTDTHPLNISKIYVNNSNISVGVVGATNPQNVVINTIEIANTKANYQIVSTTEAVKRVYLSNVELTQDGSGTFINIVAGVEAFLNNVIIQDGSNSAALGFANGVIVHINNFECKSIYLNPGCIVVGQNVVGNLNKNLGLVGSIVDLKNVRQNIVAPYTVDYQTTNDGIYAITVASGQTSPTLSLWASRT